VLDADATPMLTGRKYGSPSRSFGAGHHSDTGANVPANVRALVACGWFGIQTWIGGEAIHVMIVVLVPRGEIILLGVDLLSRDSGCCTSS